MDAKQEKMTEVFNNLGLELSNEKYNFLQILNICEQYKNERDCYFHYLVRLHDECLKLDFSKISKEMYELTNDINDMLNLDARFVGSLPLESRKN